MPKWMCLMLTKIYSYMSVRDIQILKICKKFIFAIQRKSVLAWADFSKQITFETKNTHSVFLKEKHKKL